MSSRYNNGSHYENHQRAAEMHNNAAHAHRTAADHHGKEDHETGAERSRQALEHSERAFQHSQELHRQAAEAQQADSPNEEEIAALAYELWEKRGRPQGTSDEDWRMAVEQLSARR